MQAVSLPDDRRNSDQVNTALRTDRFTIPAAGTTGCDEISSRFHLHFPKCKRKSFYRCFGKVKPFSAAIINLEHCQRILGFLCGINLPHIWIFFKQPRQKRISKLFYLSPQRYCRAGHGALALHSRQRNISLFLQAVIKALALCSQKVKAVFIGVHDIDGAGNRQPAIVNRCCDSCMDFFL